MKLKKDESGMMVVEALISFTIFVIVVFVVIYLTVIFTLHNKVQYAINSTAQQLASYSYLYKAVGIRSAEEKIKEDGSKYVSSIDDAADQIADTLNKIESLKGDTDKENFTSLDADAIQSKIDSLKEVGDSAEKTATKVTELANNPNDLMVGVMYLAFDAVDVEAKKLFAQTAAKLMVQQYLKMGSNSADEYLKGMNVIDGLAGLDFEGSSVFCDSDSRMIDIVVQYKVDLSFAKILIPDGYINIVQRATVAGWINGDGDFDGNSLKDCGVEAKW
jgi:hypothetical protein